MSLSQICIEPVDRHKIYILLLLAVSGSLIFLDQRQSGALCTCQQHTGAAGAHPQFPSHLLKGLLQNIPTGQQIPASFVQIVPDILQQFHFLLVKDK